MSDSLTFLAKSFAWMGIVFFYVFVTIGFFVGDKEKEKLREGQDKVIVGCAANAACFYIASRKRNP